MNRCPPATVVSGVHVYRLPADAEVTLCFLINTGEYCAEVLPQLESLIQSKMSPEYADKIDFNQEVDVFLDMVAHIMKVLVSGIMDKLDSSFRDMSSGNWATMTEAGEDSVYLQGISRVLVDIIPKIRNNLSTSYYKNLCSKIATDAAQR